MSCKGKDADAPGVDASECLGTADFAPTPLMRLSATQYQNTLRDLLDIGAAATIFDDLAGALSALPVDGDGDSFALMDERITQRHVDTWFAVADQASRTVAADDAMLRDLAGSCATAAALADACLTDFLHDFGTRVHRQPLTSEEWDLYRAVAADAPTGPDAFRDVLFAMLMSPRFLYHVQVDGPEIGDTLLLNPYEIASRLSYHFWQTMPDAELLAAAADGSLATDSGYEAQVARVIDDDRTRATIDQFYREWYRLEGFSGFLHTAEFDAFAAGENIDEPGRDHFGDMASRTTGCS